MTWRAGLLALTVGGPALAEGGVPYIAHLPAADRPCLASAARCDAASLVARMMPVPDPPTTCAVVSALADRLNLADFPNAARPRIARDAPTVPSDIFQVVVPPLCPALVLVDVGWTMSMTPIAAGRWDKDDDAVQVLVELRDRATDASYDAGSYLLVSGVDGAGALSVRELCGWVDGGAPDMEVCLR